MLNYLDLCSRGHCGNWYVHQGEYCKICFELTITSGYFTLYNILMILPVVCGT